MSEEDESSNEANRPGTSRSPHIARKKRECETALDWTHVLKSIAKNDQLPLKKLCIMNEVEITPGKSSSDKEQTHSDKKGKAMADSSSDFEVIMIRDDIETMYDSHDPSI